jgi:hypothetical protein
MAFPNNGVVEAPEIVPSAFGLLAVVKPENSADEDQWIRGFSQEWETEVSNLVNFDDTDATYEIVGSRATPVRHVRIKPFFIETTEEISTLGFLGLDRIARIKRQIEGGTQKAIEKELWDGGVRKGEAHDNAALSSGTATILGGGTAYAPKRALAILEQGIAAASQFGEQGLIHMTRDVAALLSSNSNMLFHDKEREHLQTMGGTPVIVGNGYSGNGPRMATVSTASIVSGTLTVNFSGAHGLSNGDVVAFELTGASLDASRNDAVVTVVDSDTVTLGTGYSPNATSQAVTGYVQSVASTGTKWIYATGTVRTYVGDVDVVNDNLAQAYDVSGNANDMRLKAIRPVAVYFDTSIHLAVRVDLTA